MRPGIKPPASLRNIYKELETDVGFRIPNNGYLAPWAKQGLLMLNAVLSVRAGETNSHQGKGWGIGIEEIGSAQTPHLELQDMRAAQIVHIREEEKQKTKP